MRFLIKKNNVEVNIIESDLEFAKLYCKENDFTYEILVDDAPTPHEPTTEEILLQLTADQEYRLCMIELGLN